MPGRARSASPAPIAGRSAMAVPGARGCDMDSPRTPVTASHPTRRAAVLAATLTLGVAAADGLSACGSGNPVDGFGGSDPEFGYSLALPIVTTNAASQLGVMTDAAKVSARLYPGAFITGPNGQLLPNPDLLTATPRPEDPQTVDYQVSDKATYSDGTPVTCTDFLLAVTAGQNAAQFGADMPMARQVQSVACQDQDKHFSVTFKEGFGGRFRELFSAGTVLPAHTVAQRAEVPDIVGALQSEAPAQLEPIAEQWRNTFDLGQTDPSEVPTFGPYRVSSRAQDGTLTLEPNPNWKADPPQERRVFLHPVGSELKGLAHDDHLVVADAAATTDFAAQELNAPNFRTRKTAGSRVDLLRLEDAGALASPEARRALGACIDRGSIAGEVKAATGVEVQPVGLRILAPTDPLAPRLKDVAEANTAVDPNRTKQQLDGTTVRIGYLKEVPRYAAMVQNITRSCAAGGVTIRPVEVDAAHPGTLGTDYEALLTTTSSFGRNPTTDVPATAPLDKVRDAERTLADAAETLPLVNEPRAVAVEQHIAGVVDNPGETGLSWNMDRWQRQSEPVPKPPSPEGNPGAI
ncbi:peptide ABC transporter [Corynebacterium heidelbergense]|uniref:Peptide ABC transporter n=2 Tax=Corynebacterium heidelbergense TaxID=2055947 RepID=A0A364VD97_9CORY|nr:peptide ABC transporter [Corynebacterium heidelbergense]